MSSNSRQLLHQNRPQLTPDEALAAILAGQTVQVIVGNDDPEDPVCLMYLDRCFEDDFEPMIHTEAVGGWSGGVKECVCEPNSDFFVSWLADPSPVSITVTAEVPPQRVQGARVMHASLRPVRAAQAVAVPARVRRKLLPPMRRRPAGRPARMSPSNSYARSEENR